MKEHKNTTPAVMKGTAAHHWLARVLKLACHQPHFHPLNYAQHRLKYTPDCTANTLKHRLKQPAAASIVANMESYKKCKKSTSWAFRKQHGFSESVRQFGWHLHGTKLGDVEYRTGTALQNYRLLIKCPHLISSNGEIAFMEYRTKCQTSKPQYASM